MNNLPRLVFRLVLVMVFVFGGGWFMGGLLNLAALVSPQMVTKVECPTGSTVKEDWVQQSWDSPGQKSLVISCVNQNGTSVPMLSNEQTSALEYKYFYPAGIAVMAVIAAAWFIWSAFRGSARTKTQSSAA